MSRRKFPKPDLEFDMPIYPCRVYLYKKRRRMDRALAWLGGNPLDGPLSGRCCLLEHPKQGRIAVVGWFDRSVVTLAHELGHAAMFTLDLIGIDVRDSNGETYLYLLSALMRRCGAK